MGVGKTIRDIKAGAEASSSITWSCDQRLLMAVLTQAIADYKRSVVLGTDDFGAKDWFLTEETNGWPCSFRQLCEYVNLDPSYVLRRVFESEGDAPLRADGKRTYATPRGRAFKHRLRGRGAAI